MPISSSYFPHNNSTHHPDHEVGEDGDPQGGEEEGQHEVFLPARLGTVGDGEEQQQEQRPRDQPLKLAADTPCGVREEKKNEPHQLHNPQNQNTFTDNCCLLWNNVRGRKNVQTKVL